jgi:hypothetical protein
MSLTVTGMRMSVVGLGGVTSESWERKRDGWLKTQKRRLDAQTHSNPSCPGSGNWQNIPEMMFRICNSSGF